MERHAYRDADFWKTLDKTDFAIISGINNQAMATLIDMMRGSRTLEQYAYESDVSTSTLYRSFTGERKKPFQYEQLLLLYEHRDPDCAVGFEHLLAANGMMLTRDIIKAQKKILKKGGFDTYVKKPDKENLKKEKSCRKACSELKSLINKMRGNRDYAQYAFDCGIPKGTLAYIAIKRRKTPLDDSKLRALYNNREPGSPVTLEQLRKANALFPSTNKCKDKEIEVVLDTVEPDDIKEKGESQIPTDTYDDFLKDMAFYLMRKPREVFPTVRAKCKDLYKNNPEVKDLLRKFRLTTEYAWNERVTEVKAFNLYQGMLSDTKDKRPEIIEKKLDKLLLE